MCTAIKFVSEFTFLGISISLIADPIIVPVHKSQPMPAVTSAVRNESTGHRDNDGPRSEPGGVNDVVTVTSTSAVSTATVLEVPLNSSITTTAG